MIRQLLSNRMSRAGIIIILLLVFMATSAPWTAPYDPLKQALRARLQFPSIAHPLGTDYYGRDMLSRIMFGARYSLTVGLVSVGIGVLAGSSLGILAGYYGGIVDQLLGGLVDVLMAFPGMLLALAIVAILGPGLFNTMLAVGIWSVPIFARIVRAVFLSTRETEYVLAARAVGVGNLRIMVRHILPACLPALIVLSTLRMSTAILTAAGLSFLGLGAQPPMPEWGSMLNESRVALRQAPWVATFTGLFITLTVTAFNFLGDALRDILDPRMK